MPQIRKAIITDGNGKVSHEYDYFNEELNEWEEYQTLSHCCFASLSFTDLCGDCNEYASMECNHCTLRESDFDCLFHLPTMSETLNSDKYSSYYVSEHWDYD